MNRNEAVQRSSWSRREVLKTAATAGLGSLLGSGALAASTEPADPDRIKRENQAQGTRDWMTNRVQIDPSTKFRSPGIEGFVSRTSARPGETITLHVSTNPPSPFTIDLYRLGYYQGHGGRFMTRLGPFQGRVQPDPPVGEMRVRECAWEPCATLAVPNDWTSGVYLGKLTAQRDGLQSYVVFVVRDDRKADFLFQCSTNTWNAYNRWPSQFALYDDGKTIWYTGPNVKTSFDRPYGKYCQILSAPLSVGSGEFLLWEFPVAYWMERHGYDVSYISNTDTHTDGEALLRGKTFLSVGHDEYWSREMFSNVKRAIEEGVNVAFLSGNAVCFVTPLLPSADGRPYRVITRLGRFGKADPNTLAIRPEVRLFKESGPDEGTLIGARNIFPIIGGGDWICRKPMHWIFNGTGMKEGDAIPGLVGWEWHGAPADIPGLEVVASGPAKTARTEGTYSATIYPGPKGNMVFNAATIWWGDALSEPPGYVRPSVYTTPRGPDPRVQRITRNLFERFRTTGIESRSKP